ncbi:hypothetical protein HPB47_020174 [Ixodes persulcatus]|uniref:Uncharacterized protein n=1 Tax=Ixodes persulcatus TaxID=34615 RepID=A0AC60QZL1_IXOPE|nr:hypothetical protein HPB47_020174 [Ixodes persulcatus]
MQDLLLQDKYFKYLFLSRLTQDALENLSSTITAKNSVPRARDLKMALHLITMSQFSRTSRSGSYNVDDSEYLAVSGLTSCGINNHPPRRKMSRQTGTSTKPSVMTSSSCSFTWLGTVHAVRKKTKLCELCLAAVMGSAASQNAGLCQQKCYIRDSSNQELVMPSFDVFGLLLVAEGEFHKHEDLITGSKKTLNDVHWSTAALTKQLPLSKCNFARR